MAKPKKAKESSKPTDQGSVNPFLRFSGLAFEMLAFIVLGVFGGMKLDEYLGSDRLWTAIGSLLGCTLAMIYVIKKIPKE